VTPADAYFGRAKTIIKQRKRIKRQTIEYRRLQHRKIAAEYQPIRRGQRSANLRSHQRQMF
jgi:hypothetical protein